MKNRIKTVQCFIHAVIIDIVYIKAKWSNWTGVIHFQYLGTYWLQNVFVCSFQIDGFVCLVLVSKNRLSGAQRWSWHRYVLRDQLFMERKNALSQWLHCSPPPPSYYFKINSENIVICQHLLLEVGIAFAFCLVACWLCSNWMIFVASVPLA